jgi:hypothetical protein
VKRWSCNSLAALGKKKRLVANTTRDRRAYLYAHTTPRGTGNQTAVRHVLHRLRIGGQQSDIAARKPIGIECWRWTFCRHTERQNHIGVGKPITRAPEAVNASPTEMQAQLAECPRVVFHITLSPPLGDHSFGSLLELRISLPFSSS